MNTSLLGQPWPAGESLVDQAVCVPFSVQLPTSRGHCQGQALHFCGMVDKSLPLSACISSSIKCRAWPSPQVLCDCVPFSQSGWK